MIIAVLSLLLFGWNSQQHSAEEIVRTSEEVFRGKSSYVKLRMEVSTPDYTRTLEMESWADDKDNGLIHTLSPRKEAGNKTLRIGNQVWMYLKRTERTMRIPPSMMMQSWNGSDFTFEDLIRESDLIVDYNLTLLGQETIEGNECWNIELTPKSHIAVVWSSMQYAINVKSFLPVKAQYFNDNDKCIRTQLFENVKTIGGRTIPTTWKMINHVKPGNATTITLLDARFDMEISPDVFSRKNLER